MRVLLYAEIRESWKAKRFLVSVLVFLCFFAAVYAVTLKKERVYGDTLIMQLHYENLVADNRCQTPPFNLQYTPKEEEAPKQREEAYLRCDIQYATSSQTNMQQSPEYFNQCDTVRYAKEHVLGYQKLQELGLSMDMMKELGITKDTLHRDHTYYAYFLNYDMKPYASPYGPTLLDFLMQIAQRDTMPLPLLVVGVLMTDQVYHDFESGTYKLIYSMPTSRGTLLIAKLPTTSFVILLSLTIALLLFSILPLLQHGLGDVRHPYIVCSYEVSTWSSLTIKAVPLSMSVALCYIVWQHG